MTHRGERTEEGWSAWARVAVVRAVVLLATTALLVGAVPSAGAQTLGEQASSAKERLRAIRSSFSSAEESYKDARYRWETTSENLQEAQAQLALTRIRLKRARRLLGMRVKHLYKTPDFGYIEVVLASEDFTDFISGMDFLSRIGRADADLVHDLKALKVRMHRQGQRLGRLEVQQRARAAEAGAKANSLEVQLAAQKEEYSRLQRAATLARTARGIDAGGSYASINLSHGFAFPVAGPHSFSDDWGNPRSGGRSHKGTDIFASRGTPCVAVVSGSVDAHEGGLGGNAIWLSGDDGNSYYYAHLDSWAVTGGHVSQGQVIAYVGNTGNAAGGACHLHFGIDAGSGWINPYPILAAAD